MTINSETRVAGPFEGNDSTVVFPFTFKVFDSDELYVVHAADAIETVLELGTDYTVTLNPDQNAAPGGTITLAAPLATDTTLTLTSDLEALQPLDLTNQGGFYPRVINNAFDRVTILIQQLKSVVSRTLKFPLSDGPVSDLPGRSARAGRVLAFDPATAEPVAGPTIYEVETVAATNGAIAIVASNIDDVITVADNIGDVTNFADVYYGPSATDPLTRSDGSPLQEGDLYFNTDSDRMRIYTGLAWQETVGGSMSVQNFSGDGVETEFVLDFAPETEVATQVFISGVYQQKNTYEIGGVDGNVLIFSEAPPAGASNIEVVVSSVVPSDDVLRGELENGNDPALGAAVLARATVSIASMVDLLAAKRDASQTLALAAYFPGVFALADPVIATGAGLFKWSPSIPRSAHDGGSVVSPTVPWLGTQASLSAFLAGTGETDPAALGCFVRLCDMLDITHFGARPIPGVDNAPSLAKAVSVSAEREAKLTAPSGTFEYAGVWDMGYPGLSFAGAGMSRTTFHCTSANRAVDILGGRPNNGAYSFTIELSDMTFEGNAATTDIIRIRINHPHLKNINLRQASTVAGCGLRIEGTVAGNYEHIVCSTNAALMSSRPLNGIVLDVDPTDGRRASCNTFIDMIIEGMMADGVRLVAADQNTFIGGTSENNAGNGVILNPGAQINTFIGVGFENGGYADIYDEGQMNKFINCYSNKNVYIGNSSRFSKVDGGYFEKIEVGVGAGFPSIDGVTIKFFSGTGGLAFGGNTSVATRNIFDHVLGGLVFPKIAGGLIALGASPFAYTNNSGRTEAVTVTGGTISSVQLTRDGVGVGSVPSPATYTLQPGDGLTVTYSSAPQLIRMPGGTNFG